MLGPQEGKGGHHSVIWPKYAPPVITFLNSNGKKGHPPTPTPYLERPYMTWTSKSTSYWIASEAVFDIGLV